VLYEVYTDGDVSLAAATAKVVLLLIYPNSATAAPLILTLVDYDIDIEGAAGTTSALVEIVESTQAGAGAGSSAGVARQLRGTKPVGLTTAVGSGGFGCTVNKGYTTDPTVLTPLVGPRKFIQGSTWTKQFPLGFQPVTPSPANATTVSAIGIRVTAPVAAACRASLQVAIGGTP
jgi:hypothetical protein